MLAFWILIYVCTAGIPLRKYGEHGDRVVPVATKYFIGYMGLIINPAALSSLVMPGN